MSGKWNEMKKHKKKALGKKLGNENQCTAFFTASAAFSSPS